MQKQITVWVETELIDRLDKLAVKEGSSRAQLMREGMAFVASRDKGSMSIRMRINRVEWSVAKQGNELVASTQLFPGLRVSGAGDWDELVHRMMELSK